MSQHWLHIGILRHMLGRYVGTVGVVVCAEKCVWKFWALPWYTTAWTRVTHDVCSPSRNSCQGILSLHNLWIRCSFGGAFWGGGWHVFCQKSLCKNHPRIEWMILVARHVSRDRDWGCFVCIFLHWDVFLEALGWGCLCVIGRIFPCGFICRSSHLLWPFLVDCNFWRNLLAGRWVSFSYTLWVPLACWDGNFYVNGHELGNMGGDNTVEKEFDNEKIGCGRSTISRIIYSVSANGKPCSVGILLLRYVIYHKPAVCHILPTRSGGVLFVYENIIGSFYPPWHSLRQATQFISIWSYPELTMFRIFHEVSHFH